MQISFNFKLTKLLKNLSLLAAIGAVASLTDYSLMSALLMLKFPLWICATAGYTAGTFLVYVFANKFVFTASKPQKPIVELVLFFIAGLIGLIFNDIIIIQLHENWDFQLWLAKVTSVVVVFIWNTIARYSVVYVLRTK